MKINLKHNEVLSAYLVGESPEMTVFMRQSKVRLLIAENKECWAGPIHPSSLFVYCLNHPEIKPIVCLDGIPEEEKIHVIKKVYDRTHISMFMNFLTNYVKERRPEYEGEMLKFPTEVMTGYLSLFKNNEPWPEIEEQIYLDASLSHKYAVSHLKARFRRGEPAIRNSNLARFYQIKFGFDVFDYLNE